MVLNSNNFDFKQLIEESDLICKPEDLASGVVNIDYSVYQNYFSEDAYINLKSIIKTKRQFLKRKRKKFKLSN